MKQGETLDGNDSVPTGNRHRLEASVFERKGDLPSHSATGICFARSGFVLQSDGVALVHFPFHLAFLHSTLTPPILSGGLRTPLTTLRGCTP